MLILDTHAVVWWTTGIAPLGKRATSELGRTKTIGIPAIVFWEVALLVRRQRLVLTIPVGEWARQVAAIPRVRVVPLDLEIAVLADSLQMHSDPADRFIVASALTNSARLVTKDALIGAAGVVETLW